MGRYQKPVAVTVAVAVQVMLLAGAIEGIGIPGPIKLAMVTLAGSGKLTVRQLYCRTRIAWGKPLV